MQHDLFDDVFVKKVVIFYSTELFDLVSWFVIFNSIDFSHFATNNLITIKHGLR